MSLKPLKKPLFFLLKLALTVWAIHIVVKSADLPEIWEYINSASATHIILAFIALNTGQVVSAMRMRYYFAHADFKLSRKHAILLYFTGNFFNLFLPGAIGGDGYKAYLAKKYGNLPLKQAVKLMIANRANGFLMLFLVVIAVAMFSNYIADFPYIYFLLTSLALAIIFSYIILALILLKEPLDVQLGAAKYSLFIQLSVLLAAYLLFTGSNMGGNNLAEYLLIFMISSIISILPISIGGIGLRELTFFQGAHLLGLDPELGVAISITYFAINSVSSLVGLVFWHRLKELDSSDDAMMR